MHTTPSNCTHTNLFPWGECQSCGANAATIEAYAKINEHQAKIDAMTPQEREAEALAAAEHYRADAKRRENTAYPWRLRSH